MTTESDMDVAARDLVLSNVDTTIKRLEQAPTGPVCESHGKSVEAQVLSGCGSGSRHRRMSGSPATKRFYTGSVTNITNPGNKLSYKILTTNAVDASFYGASLMYR